MEETAQITLTNSQLKTLLFFVRNQIEQGKHLIHHTIDLVDVFKFLLNIIIEFDTLLITFKTKHLFTINLLIKQAVEHNNDIYDFEIIVDLINLHKLFDEHIKYGELSNKDN
jgi:hypothetical protein